MEVYFQLVNDAGSLKKACDELKNDSFLGFDVETTELDPYRGELRLVQLSNGKNTVVIDVRAFASRPSDENGLRTNPELAPLRAVRPSFSASGDGMLSIAA